MNFRNRTVNPLVQIMLIIIPIVVAIVLGTIQQSPDLITQNSESESFLVDAKLFLSLFIIIPFYRIKKTLEGVLMYIILYPILEVSLWIIASSITIPKTDGNIFGTIVYFVIAIIISIRLKKLSEKWNRQLQSAARDS